MTTMAAEGGGRFVVVRHALAELQSPQHRWILFAGFGAAVLGVWWRRSQSIAYQQRKKAQERRRFHNLALRLSPDHLRWLESITTKYSLSDVSTALQMVLDYAAQECDLEAIYRQTESNSSNSSSGNHLGRSNSGLSELTYLLHESHLEWLDTVEKSKQLNMSDAIDALIEYVRTGGSESESFDDSLVFEIDRSESRRSKRGGITFTMKC